MLRLPHSSTRTDTFLPYPTLFRSTSQTVGPAYEDVSGLARALVKAAPERMSWASNFPHAQAHKFGYPNEAALLDLMLDWAPNAADWQKIFVDNPAELYGFR